MKILKDHTLLYDVDCPMCRVYTAAFVKHGWLDKQGRRAYQQTPGEWKADIDMIRAKSEIALLNRKTKEVIYGIDALSMIVAHKMPWLRPVLQVKWFRRLLHHLYFFISYNRKVIAAVNPSGNKEQECTPAFHAGYRVAYLVFAWVLTSFILSRYTALVNGLIPTSPFYREFLVCGGQIIFQGLLLMAIDRSKLMDYLGNMMTVSLIGALLLIPMLIISRFIPHVPAVIAAVYFLMIAAIMLLEHFRRMKLLALGVLPSIGWIVYRLLVLFIIL